MLKHMRKFHLDDQSAILEKVNTLISLSAGAFSTNHANTTNKKSQQWLLIGQCNAVNFFSFLLFALPL